MRKAELGLGVMIRSLRDGTPSTIVKSSGPAPATYAMATKTPNYPQRARNGFNPQSPNFDAFSSAVKGLPLILPDGRILLYLKSEHSCRPSLPTRFPEEPETERGKACDASDTFVL